MIEKYYFEFSKIYCRLMRLEIQLKERLKPALLSYYKEDIIDVFKKFFFNKERLTRYNKSTGNSFLAILKNPQMLASQKFIKLVNIMYLSDILFIILCCEQFRISEITNNFYFKVPKKFGTLMNSRQLLLDLRNTIAHYNFRDYEKNKNMYLQTLMLFETHMGRNIKGITEFPRFTDKPSIKAILVAIKNLRPDLLDIDFNDDNEIEYFYNKHRILLDLCDEIALYNGYTPVELPSPWTIFRAMYGLKPASKKTKKIDVNSLPLFSSLRNKQINKD